MNWKVLDQHQQFDTKFTGTFGKQSNKPISNIGSFDSRGPQPSRIVTNNNNLNNNNLTMNMINGMTGSFKKESNVPPPINQPQSIPINKNWF